MFIHMTQNIIEIHNWETNSLISLVQMLEVFQMESQTTKMSLINRKIWREAETYALTINTINNFMQHVSWLTKLHKRTG